MKIVINRCYGGFSLSEATTRLFGIESVYDIDRSNVLLVAMVEENPAEVSGRYARLAVVDIPDNATDWEIVEYDGFESVTAVVDGKLVHL